MYTSCVETIQPDYDCNCPDVVSSSFGPRIPPYRHTDLHLSPDKRYLAFNSGARANIVDLTNLQRTLIDLKPLIPANVRLLYYWITDWCPYDADKALIIAITETDTNNSGRFIYGNNLYVYSISTHQLIRITPPHFSKGRPYFAGSLLKWLPTSKFGNDSIMFSLNMPDYGTYHVQSQQFTPLSLNENDMILYSHTLERTFTVFSYRDYIREKWYINDIQLPFEWYTGDFFSWSPNDKFFALTVGAAGRDARSSGCGYSEIWIYNVDSLLTKQGAYIYPIQRINLRKQFCKYSQLGAHAEFTSDSTLAVSMHTDGDTLQSVYEISLNGKLLRQITSTP